jgi:hypothetical protein
LTDIVDLIKDTPIKGPVHNYDPHNYDDFYADEYGGYGVGMGGRGKFNPREKYQFPLFWPGAGDSGYNIYNIFR